MDTIGTRLKAERLAKGISQERLGLSAGVTKAAISNIENGLSGMPLASTLEPICRILGINPRWLIDGKGPKALTVAQSQSMRFTADIIRDAQAALRSMARIGGYPPSWETDPENLALAINTVIEVGTADGGNVIDLMAKIADTMRKGIGNAADNGTDGSGDSAAISPIRNGKPKA